MTDKIASNRSSKGTRLSLKSRLSLIVFSALLIIIIGEIFLQVQTWKQAIKSEVDSSFTLAKTLAQGELLWKKNGSDNQERALLDALIGLRHISVVDKNTTSPSIIEIHESNLYDQAGVPDWFVRFIDPYDGELPRIEFSAPQFNASIIIEADPRDEIIEVWEDFSIQLLIIVFFAIVISMFIYFGIDMGLRPLNELLSGFEKLESGSFNVKVNEDVSAELAPIHNKFNHMVSVLKRTSEDNSLLAKKMVNLQEEERHALTRELHDEMAPHLFGIRVTNTRIGSLLKEKRFDSISEELSSVDNIVENLQQQMRRLLSRLRPLILDDLNINEAILSLIDKKEISRLNIDWNIEIDGLDEELSDTISVTLYRICQECITNIVRHSGATKVEISISIITRADLENTFYNYLNIIIQDNGKGLPADMNYGFGLIGMRERVQALGGKFELAPAELGGLKITALIPLK